jgi:hypothetical protein
MPLIDIPSLAPSAPVTTPPRMALTPGALGEKEPVRPGFGALAEAAFERENVIASAMASAAWGADNTPDDNYSGWDSIKGTKYEPYFGRFTDLVNGGKTPRSKPTSTARRTTATSSKRPRYGSRCH